MAKGDWWAPCPFHQEKSASFHVDDRKGYYYCFGCHAKGDALSFVKETENLRSWKNRRDAGPRGRDDHARPATQRPPKRPTAAPSWPR